jgi:hypothetical protein
MTARRGSRNSDHGRSSLSAQPTTWLVGDVDHADFGDAVRLICEQSRVIPLDDRRICPELIVMAQSRPGTVQSEDVERLRRRAPLAGVVSLAGSWCEGETRTGRPLPSAVRLYWYEFEPWWRQRNGPGRAVLRRTCVLSIRRTQYFAQAAGVVAT